MKKMEPLKIPRGSKDPDIEDEVADYQSRLPHLAREIHRYTTKALDAMMADIERMIGARSIEGQGGVMFLNSAADGATLKTAEDLIRKCPDAYRAKLWKKIVSAVSRGNWTNRRAIQDLTRIHAYAVLGDMTKATARILTGVAEDGYYRGLFMLQKTAGLGWEAEGIKSGRTQIIVDRVFGLEDARRFMNPVADMTSERVIMGLIGGFPWKKVKKDVDEVKQANAWRSQRESRTVITDTAQEAHKDAYKRHHIEEYQFVATYDERTCPICGNLDGKRFPVSEGKAGVNYPPMHPNCRCTTVAAFDKETEDLMRQRKLVDRATGEVHEIPRDFDYKMWYKTFGPGRTDGVEYIPKYRNK